MKRSHGDSPQLQVSEAGISWDGKTSAVVGESQQLFDRQIKDPPHTLDAIYYARPMRQAPSELCFFCISRTVMFSSFR